MIVLVVLAAGILLPAIWAAPDILRLTLSSLASLGAALLYTLIGIVSLLSLGGLLLLYDRVQAWYNPPIPVPTSPSRPKRSQFPPAPVPVPDADEDDSWLREHKHKSLGPGEKREGIAEKLWRKARERDARPKAERPKWREDGEGVELKEMASGSGVGLRPGPRRRVAPMPPGS